jgi:hypothetical protein
MKTILQNMTDLPAVLSAMKTQEDPQSEILGKIQRLELSQNGVEILPLISELENKFAALRTSLLQIEGKFVTLEKCAGETTKKVQQQEDSTELLKITLASVL